MAPRPTEPRSDEDERAEQHVDPEPLEARLVTDRGADVVPGREPRRCDPEDADLSRPSVVTTRSGIRGADW